MSRKKKGMARRRKEDGFHLADPKIVSSILMNQLKNFQT